MPMNDNRRVAAASTRLTRRPGLTLALVALPLVLAACSSGSSTPSTTTQAPSDTSSASASTDSASPSSATPTSDSATPTDTASTSPSATASTSPSVSTSATGTPSSASPSATPSGTPSTVAPSPSGNVAGITVAYSPVVAAASQQVTITAGTNRSLAGRTAYIVKWNDGAPRVLGTGTVIGATGVARTYVQLLRTGVLQVVVPQSPLVAGPFDPTTPLLAQSARFTVTIP